MTVELNDIDPAIVLDRIQGQIEVIKWMVGIDIVLAVSILVCVLVLWIR